jgi:FRG domain
MSLPGSQIICPTNAASVAEPVVAGVRHRNLDSWGAFVQLIYAEHANCQTYIYRGQADARWHLESTLDRIESEFPRKKNFGDSSPDYFSCPPVGRDTHLKRFKQVVRGQRASHPPPLEEDQWWTLAQHHGLATPMMDWTYSPFVALYFAFEDRTVEFKGRSEEPDQRVVVTLLSHIIGNKDKDDDPAPRSYSPDGVTSIRVNNQAGLFLKMPRRIELEKYVREHFPGEDNSEGGPAMCVLELARIPNTGRIECLKFLNKMNINRLSLFPCLDGAARYVNQFWELDDDTSIGYIPREL